MFPSSWRSSGFASSVTSCVEALLKCRCTTETETSWPITLMKQQTSNTNNKNTYRQTRTCVQACWQTEPLQSHSKFNNYKWAQSMASQTWLVVSCKNATTARHPMQPGPQPSTRTPTLNIENKYAAEPNPVIIPEHANAWLPCKHVPRFASAHHPLSQRLQRQTWTLNASKLVTIATGRLFVWTGSFPL